jgi:hypothetical protein
MRFRVPQFIDIEDKIFGPFTFKQFVYLAGGAGLSYIIYKTVNIYIAAPLIMGVASLALALTFIKVNSKPFIEIMQAFFLYLFQSKLYVWTKELKKPETGKKEGKKEAEQPKYAPKLTQSKLKDISWSLDVLDMRRK